MLVKTFGSALNGIEAITVTIEVNIDRGVQFFLVGLPDSAVKESQQRIEAALNNNNLKYPKKKITINMAPADIRKEGSSYDLPIAIAILAASEQVSAELLDKVKSRMQELVAQDIAIVKESVGTQEAIARFAAQGMKAKEKLFK